MFNVGVEIGQLLFIAVIRVAGLAQAGPVYAIGGVAAYWLIERAASF